MFRCLALMDKAAVLNSLCFDLLSLCQYCRAAPEVDVGGGQIAEAFVIPAMVVMLDEGGDGRLKLTFQIVVFKQDAVLEGLVPALDLALRQGMVRSPAHVIHAVLMDVFGEIPLDVTGAVFAEQPRLVQHGDAVAPLGGQGNVERRVDIVCPHVGAELPAHDVVREVIQYGGQIEPAPANHLEIDKVDLPAAWQGMCIMPQLCNRKRLPKKDCLFHL